MDGDLGAYVRGEINKSGLEVMRRSGTTASVKPRRRAGDHRPGRFQGLQDRVPVSPLWTSMFKAFDASPASINFSEVYSALQTKIVEGQENPLALISTAKLMKCRSTCSLTNHMWDGFWFLMNRRLGRACRRHPPIVAKNVNAAAVKSAPTPKSSTQRQGRAHAEGPGLQPGRSGAFRDKLRAALLCEWKGNMATRPGRCSKKAVGKLS